MNEHEFQDRVRQALEPHSSALVAVLHKLVAFEYPSGVASIDFEVFPEAFTSGFPVRAFFVDAQNTEFFLYEAGHAQYPSPVDPGLLEIDHVYEIALEAALAASRPDSDPYTLAGRALIPWFSRCWTEAGGLRFARRAQIGLHDDLEAYDLVQQSWGPA